MSELEFTAEQLIYIQAQELEHEYFQDLTLKDIRILERLSQVELEDGLIVEMELQGSKNPVINDWKFRIEELNDHDGRCDPEIKTIYIQTGLEGEVRKGVLLHELIHAYEGMLWKPHRDWLLLWLYRSLCESHGEAEIDKLINSNSWVGIQQPAHSVFFFLKSLDLDDRMGWKHGTVFGYGRDEYFSARTR